jgi:hypothetical protein
MEYFFILFYIKGSYNTTLITNKSNKVTNQLNYVITSFD